MLKEYRTSRGVAFEIAANGHIVPPTINLRSLGCPDWLASKVERSREARALRENAPAPKPTTTDEALRKRAAAIGAEVAADQEEIRKQEALKKQMEILSGRTTR